MLTATDIHYLAGHLTLASSPDDVSIELGTMVYDQASEQHRDVDITIQSPVSSLAFQVYSGIEVKNHKRPLDSTHVEQLSCKLLDMPDLERRAIVSASGYFGPAIKKAAKHNIELFELVEWTDRSKGFEHFQSEFVAATCRSLNWHGPVHAQINPHSKIRKKDQDVFTMDQTIYFGNEEIKSVCPNLRTLLKNAQISAQQELIKSWAPPEIQSDDTKHATAEINLSDSPYIHAPSGKVYIEQLRFTGAIRWKITEQHTEYRLLRKLGEDLPESGCCVFEMPGWGLCGLVVSNTNRSIQFIRIPISERVRQKIKERPITRKGKSLPDNPSDLQIEH